MRLQTSQKQIDCGIAMAHIDIATKFHGITGTWEYLESPEIAMFKPLK
ncbi:MAG: hypothetical protein LRY71_19555 [Bacillaceae bacterium]|nr:hypothetical protein [Bacillaceae bacterium]